MYDFCAIANKQQTKLLKNFLNIFSDLGPILAKSFILMSKIMQILTISWSTPHINI